eukprot:GHRQ01025006.1.p3 GENE.GHRQ01025006.1~~GHRQ01025006.1.p3  ORF type:complete len:102 (+),score=14.46 GHRQ01025006.1:24-329(+)
MNAMSGMSALTGSPSSCCSAFLHAALPSLKLLKSYFTGRCLSTAGFQSLQNHAAAGRHMMHKPAATAQHLPQLNASVTAGSGRLLVVAGVLKRVNRRRRAS